MKKNALRLLVVALVAILGSMALQAKPKINEELVKGYFLRTLNGNTEQFYNTQKIKNLAEAEVAKQQVWQVWVNANNAFEEEKLPEFTPLHKEAGKWFLPENLEKDAIMPFHFGTKGEQPADGYPLYLYIHGSGEKNREWATGFKICSGFDDAPSVYFIPQIPNIGEYYRWYQKSKQFAWNRLIRLAFVSGKVNPNKLYIFGISEGGYGSQRLGSFYGDYLAGVGPMAGGEPLINAPVVNLSHTPYSMVTGENDLGFCRNQFSAHVGEQLDSLEKIYPGEFIHRVYIEPKMGHHVTYALTTPWLKNFTRDPFPHHFLWENFEMDGIYRKGYYNIAVIERSSTDNNVRDVFEFTATGNKIYVDVNAVTYSSAVKEPRWGLTLRYNRHFQDVNSGKFIVYLNEKLVDLTKPLTLYVNKKNVFTGKVTLDVRNMVNSLATFGDPERIYPAAIEVDLSTMSAKVLK